MTPAVLDPVVEVLQTEVEQLGRLVALLEEEAAVLRRGHASKLATVSLRKEAVALELRRLERARRAALDDLAGTLGVPVGRLGLGTLTRLLPQAAGRLVPLRAALREVLAKVTALGDRNRVLLEESIRCLRDWMDALRTAMGETPTYAASGRRVGAAVAVRVLDRTA